MPASPLTIVDAAALPEKETLWQGVVRLIGEIDQSALFRPYTPTK